MGQLRGRLGSVQVETWLVPEEAGEVLKAGRPTPSTPSQLIQVGNRTPYAGTPVPSTEPDQSLTPAG